MEALFSQQIYKNAKWIYGDEEIETIVYDDMLKVILVSAIDKAGLDMNILKVRKCTNCFCTVNYMNQVPDAELEKLFLP